MKTQLLFKALLASALLIPVATQAQNDPTGDQWWDHSSDIVTPSYNYSLGELMNWPGNVGINEAVPLRKLHISKYLPGDELEEDIDNTVGLRLSYDKSIPLDYEKYSWDIFAHPGGQGIPGYMGIRHTNYPTSIMKIFPIGIGIGLDQGDMIESELHLKDGAIRIGMASDPYKIRIASNQIEFDRAFRSYIVQKNPNGQLAFAIGDPYSEKMLINEFGNIGIGTTAPVSHVHIAGGHLTIDESVNHYWTSSWWKSRIELDKGSAIVLKEAIEGEDTGYLGFGMNDNGWYFIKSDAEPGNSGSSARYAMHVNTNGKLTTREIEVSYTGSGGWPDYVFGEEYSLKSLEEVEEFIEANGHLPGVPSEEQVKENGINLGNMDAILLQKIEEMTLYMIELKKENQQLSKQLQELKN